MLEDLQRADARIRGDGFALMHVPERRAPGKGTHHEADVGTAGGGDGVPGGDLGLHL